MTMLTEVIAAQPRVKARKPQCRSVRDGDEALYAWGDAKRAGEIEALLRGAVDAMHEGGARGVGVYSNPVLARVMACDQWRMAVALAVDNEINTWRKDKPMQLWARIADAIYAAPGHVKNADAAADLGVSERTVERCLSSMRRLILVSARCGFVTGA